MVLADDRILEFLDQEGPHTPVRISRDERMNYQRLHVNRRLLKLTEAGLVEKGKIGQGVYTISDAGRDYLAGELDARDLPEPE